MTLRAVAGNTGSDTPVVESVTGNIVNNTDPANPVVNIPITGTPYLIGNTGATGGTATTVPVSDTNTAGSIALRSTGGVLQVGTPVASTDATTKAYVDTAVADIITQGPAIADLTDPPTAADYNAILSVLRANGLIAPS